MWIPGRSDIYGNDKADKLAKTAASSVLSNQAASLTLSDAKNLMLEECRDKWIKDFQESPGGISYKQIFSTPNTVRQTKYMSRRHSRILF